MSPMDQPGPRGNSVQTLSNQVWQCLDWELLDGALVAAEQLVALCLAADARHVHGLVLYRLGRYQSAMASTSGQNHIGCLYIYAQCCLKLGKHVEGIHALESSRSLWSNAGTTPSSLTTRSGIPDSAAVFLILGKLYRARGDRVDGAHALAFSARNNPYLWENLTALCETPGFNLVTNTLFPDAEPSSPSTAAGPSYTGSSGHTNNPSLHSIFMPPAADPEDVTRQDPFGTPMMPPPPTKRAIIQDSSTSFGSFNNTSTDLPGGTPLQFGRPRNITPSPAPGNQEVHSGLQSVLGNIASFAGATNNGNTGGSGSGSGQSQIPITPLRKKPPSRRMLLGDLSFTPRPKLESTPRVPSTTASNKFNGKNGVRIMSSNTIGASIINNVATSVLTAHIYERLINAYKHLGKFESELALKELLELPADTAKTPMALAMAARANLQLMKYKVASSYYQKLRDADPYRVEDMDDYSKVLWQERKELELGYLAHEIMEIDRKAWQAWCVLGNSLSLQRDPVHAVECFKRAVQLEPKCSPAYALQGHEYLSNDELQNAQDAFRLAIRADTNNFNAWYGLGLVLLRLGSIDQAELHVRQALRLNSQNAVLISFMGTIMERRGNYSQAMAQYRRAVDLQPHTPIARFKMAEALMSAEQYEEAILELQKLEKTVPDDASVHFVLGRAYLKLDRLNLAIKHLTAAYNLDPRAGDIVKPELEAVAAREHELATQRNPGSARVGTT